MSSHKKPTKNKQAKKTNIFGKFFLKLSAIISDSWPVIFLSLVVAVLCFLNYDRGTFLTGWDNLHPEFDPALYLKRSFFSVWQEYQGTGLLGGMAYAADLPRVILIYLINLTGAVATSDIRYFTTFLPLFIGVTATYAILHKIFSHTKHTKKTIQISSFLGSLFYLLNLSTVQTFFVPFETFTWFYGFFPLTIYYLIHFFEKPKTSNFLRLALVSFLSGPAFYVETMFVVTILCVTPLVIENISKDKKYFANIFQSVASILAITISNLFWLLPISFFVFTKSQVTTQNHINSISSIETYFRNLEFASLPNLFNLKGYLFKYLDLGANNQYEPLLSPWLNHLNSPFTKIISLIFVLLIILGIYYSFKTKIKHHLSFFGILFISSFFLLGGGLLLNNTIPLVGELFRSPFTKFSLTLSFSFSFFFAVGIIFLLDLFSFLDTKLTYNLTLFTTCLLLFIYLSPAFSGNFINKNMRVSIPDEYFELFSYLRDKPADNRVAIFPQYTFWGWNYYSWGYRGSGFTWYGIKQPTLDRAFDPWEKTSEKYYEDISTALYSQDHTKFNQTINKYDVAYLLLDMSLIAPDTKVNLGLNYLDRILATTDQYQLEKVFGENLLLYKNKAHQDKNFISLNQEQTDSLQVISQEPRPSQQWYERAGFLNTNLNLTQNKAFLNIPSISETENSLAYQIEYKKSDGALNLKLTPILPFFFLNNVQHDIPFTSQIITIPIPSNLNKVILSLDKNYLSFDLPYETPTTTSYAYLSQVHLPTNRQFTLSLYQGIPTEQYPIINSLINSNAEQCYLNKENRKIETITAPRSVTLLGTDVVACLSAPLPPVNPNQLLGLSFTYYSPTLTTANVNITNDNLGTTNTSQPFEASKTPKRGQVFIEPSPDNKKVNLLLEAEDTKSVQEITYKDVYLSSHETIQTVKISLPKIKPLTIALNSSESSKLQISLPITNTSFDIIQTPQANSLFPENRNCDRFNKGETVKINKQDTILYQSQNAIQCDYLNLRHLPHSLNYLIGFETKNEKGLPLITCLENHATRRCDVYERLKGNLKGQQYLTQTINNPNEPNGFTLHLLNQSFGNLIGQNTLKSITIHPTPLNFLTNITQSDNQETNTNSQEISFKSTHPAEFLYTLSISSPIENKQPIHLNLYQTRSDYWQAIVLPDEYQDLNPWQSTVKIFLNYQSLKKLEPQNHDQWYNSWKLPPNCTQKSSNCHQLAIIYLPQYLQFFGLVILLFTPIIFLPLLLYQKTKS